MKGTFQVAGPGSHVLPESLWPQIPSRDNSWSLLDLSYEQPLEDSGETQLSLTYCDGGCYAIRYPQETMLNPRLHYWVGDTDGLENLQRFYSQFALCETISSRAVQCPNPQNATAAYQLP
jgi:hypothetical protein